MSYNIDVVVPIRFVDGKVLIELTGHTIDLMKLDSVEEFRTILQAIAAFSLSAEFGSPTTAPAQLLSDTEEMEAGFSAVAAKVGEQFRDFEAKMEQRLQDLSAIYESAAKATGSGQNV